MKPKTIHVQIGENGGVDAAVTFLAFWETIDPRSRYHTGEAQPQRVTTCVLRVLGKGPKETFAGVAICNPRDVQSDRTGQIVALSRALEDLAGEDRKTCRSMARRWFFEQEHAAKAPASEPIAADLF